MHYSLGAPGMPMHVAMGTDLLMDNVNCVFISTARLYEHGYQSLFQGSYQGDK